MFNEEVRMNTHFKQRPHTHTPTLGEYAMHPMRSNKLSHYNGCKNEATQSSMNVSHNNRLPNASPDIKYWMWCALVASFSACSLSHCVCVFMNCVFCECHSVLIYGSLISFFLLHYFIWCWNARAAVVVTDHHHTHVCILFMCCFKIHRWHV